jgi:hypothetical protein
MKLADTSLLLVSFLLSTALLFGQAPVERREPGFWVRMERFYDHEDVCILVNTEGNYHLERVFSNKSEVYVGSLDAATVADLTAKLDAEQLRGLSQQAIRTALFSDTLDHFWIAVSRDGTLQSLNFPNVESRKPYRKSLDPLLNWLGILERSRKNGTQLATPPGRCVPPTLPMPIQSENSDPVTAAATTSPPKQRFASQDFLFRIVRNHFNPGGHVSRTCVIVRSDGRYRLEKSKQSILESRQSKVYQGSVSPATLQELEKRLNAPELTRKRQEPVSDSAWSMEADSINVFIPRPDGVQQLLFRQYFNVHGRPTEVGGMSNMQYRVDQDAKVIEPIEDWVKRNIEETKNDSVKDAVPSECQTIP